MQTLAMPTVARIDSPSAPAPEPLPAPVRPTHRGATPVGRQSSRRRQERSTTMRIPQPQCAVQRKFVDDESSSVLDAAQSCLPSLAKTFAVSIVAAFTIRRVPISRALFRCHYSYSVAVHLRLSNIHRPMITATTPSPMPNSPEDCAACAVPWDSNSTSCVTTSDSIASRRSRI